MSSSAVIECREEEDQQHGDARRRSGGGGSFTITPQELKDLMEVRGEDSVRTIQDLFGDTAQLCARLGTSPHAGLSSPDQQDFAERRTVFGANVIPQPKSKSFITLLWEALQDTTLIILIVSAIISLGLSFYHPDPNGIESNNTTDPSCRPSGPTPEEGPGGVNTEWIEGAAILVTVLVVIFVTAATDYTKEKQFRGLQSKIDTEQTFSVVRSGEIQQIPTADIVVGDVCLIKYGDLLPADGILLQGNDLKLDESSLTGESDQVPKGDGVDLMLLSGTHIMEGSGRMVVTAVGPNSQAGIIFTLLSQGGGGGEAKRKAKNDGSKQQIAAGHIESNLNGIEMPPDGKYRPVKKSDDQNSTQNGSMGSENALVSSSPRPGKEKPVLQAKLTKMAVHIGYVGTGVAFLTILVLIIRFCIKTYVICDQDASWTHIQELIRYIIIGVTVLVVAVPEGLPLAVTLSLAYSVKKMIKDNNLVRHLDACETMGSATTICSDKTGTLTTNRMTAVEAYIAGRHFESQTTLPKSSDLPEKLQSLILDGISLNSSYSSRIEAPKQAGAPPTQIGNKTECALLGLVSVLGLSYESRRQEVPEESHHRVYTFNSSRKCMGTIIALPDSGFRLFVKGASEVIIKKCDSIIGESGEPESFGPTQHEALIRNVIEPMASRGLRTISIAYRDFAVNNFAPEPDWNDEEGIMSQLTSLAVVGIEDPVRPEVPQAIVDCQRAGITVRMVTGDNISTARAIALKCGILKPDDEFLVLEGKEFNHRIRSHRGVVDQTLFDQVWPRLRVLARSSPSDKYTLVKHMIASKLNKNREVIAVTGDGTNDGPALKMADVGFAMGITGTDVAKEASDIILTDDNFTSIVKACMWGRNVYDSIAKFLQFQLTVNVVAVVAAFVGACVIQDSPLKAVQMLWVNLIMDTLASLALATEKPTKELLLRKPYGRTKALISRRMFINIIGSAAYQLVVVFVILFKGADLFGIESGFAAGPTSRPTQHFTIIFNVFVLMTLANEINCRKIHGERNVLTGLFSNPIFDSILVITLVAQVIIIQYGGDAFKTTELTASQWGWCVLFGLGQLAWYQVIVSIPTKKLSKSRLTFYRHPPVDLIDCGTQTDDIQLQEMHSRDPQFRTRARILWIRSINRLSAQLRVVQAFRTGIHQSAITHRSGSPVPRDIANHVRLDNFLGRAYTPVFPQTTPTSANKPSHV